MKKLRLLGAVCAFAIALLSSPVNASLVVPAELDPGDAYHVIFVTSTTTIATSTNIGTYDDYVQAAAFTAGIGDSNEWLALGSTADVNAIDHLAPLFNSDPSAPIYNQNGDKIATGYADLWDGSLVNPVQYDEYGTTDSQVTNIFTWTGTATDGTATDGELGHAASVTLGDAKRSDSAWTVSSATGGGSLYRLYAVSQQFVVPGVPLPAAFWLFGSGLLGLIGIARRKKAA